MGFTAVIYLTTIGDRIKHIRKLNGWTQKELGDKINMLNSTVSNYENNRSTPDANTLYDLSNVLGCSVDYLLGLTDDVQGVVTDGQITDEDIEKAKMADEIMHILISKGFVKPGEVLSDEKRERFLRLLEKTIELSEI